MVMTNTNIVFSRRRFAQLLGAGAACAAVVPGTAIAESVLRSATGDVSPALSGIAGTNPTISIVRLSSNENPYGPSPAALKAMTDAFGLAWRYPDEHVDVLVEKLAKLNGVSTNQILLGNGSGEILKVCAAAFTGPSRTAQIIPAKNAAVLASGKLVVADPTFEAIVRHANVSGAQVVKVPLTRDYRHDLAKMLVAAKGTGLIYICNPNNPTASITPKDEIREFLSRAPGETVILIDEAYHHYVESNDYESVIPVVKQYPNLIVARTFSKIFGMAGLRCGYCVARPEVIERLRSHQTWDSVNIMALAAAVASLNDADQVANGRQLNSETKRYLYGELDALGYHRIPSQANFLMIDLRRPVGPVIAAMKQRNVEVGRVFPALPNHMRVTIGKRAEMESFLAAFRQVMSGS